MLPAHKQTLESLLADTVKQVAEATQGGAEAFAPPTITLERPKVAAHGDIACNVAMQLAKPLRANPRQLAQQIVDAVLAHPQARGLVEAAEVAGPGFINLRLAPAAKQAVIGTVFVEKEAFGRSQRDAGKQVLVEFVSANPTGPLHVGHGRQAALGDALVERARYRRAMACHREFYYNDAGRADPDARCVDPGACPRPEAAATTGCPRAAYNGEYIGDIARDYMNGETVPRKMWSRSRREGDVDDLDAIRRFAVA